MLLETLLLNKINVISMNTDGLVIQIDKSQLEFVRMLYKQWETETLQTLEETYYDLYVRRDVNNYFAIKSDNTQKLKGIFKKTQKGKPSIISEALREYFINGILPETFIPAQTDIRKFIFYFKCGRGWTLYQKVSGKTEPTQSISRWYVSKGVKCIKGVGFHPLKDVGDIIKIGPMTDDQIISIKRKTPANEWPNEWIQTISVSNGKNSVIINKLPDLFPDDINFNYYITEVNKTIGKMNFEMSLNQVQQSPGGLNLL